jgi:TatD DNase family protein
MYIDTHTHIYTEEFDADRDEVVERARRAGASALLLPNIDGASVRPMLDACRRYPDMCRPMMGLHPTELPTDPAPLLDRMETALSEAGNPYVAVGEVGLDFYWDSSRREEQIAAFSRQAGWAARYGLPLMVHSRSAHRDLVDTLLPLAGTLTGVFHCFSGSAETADELLTKFPGFVLGIGGVLTFKKAKLPAVLHSRVPLSRLVVETDAPYLTPAPHRGERNEPSYVPFVIARLAEIYGTSVEETERQLLENTLRVFPKLRA